MSKFPAGFWERVVGILNSRVWKYSEEIPDIMKIPMSGTYTEGSKLFNREKKT